MRKHWRMCDHPRFRVVYRDPIIWIGICYKCRIRHGEFTRLGDIISQIVGNWLVRKYSWLVMSKVFREKINWREAGDF